MLLQRVRSRKYVTKWLLCGFTAAKLLVKKMLLNYVREK